LYGEYEKKCYSFVYQFMREAGDLKAMSEDTFTQQFVAKCTDEESNCEAFSLDLWSVVRAKVARETPKKGAPSTVRQFCTRLYVTERDHRSRGNSGNRNTSKKPLPSPASADEEEEEVEDDSESEPEPQRLARRKPRRVPSVVAHRPKPATTAEPAATHFVADMHLVKEPKSRGVPPEGSQEARHRRDKRNLRAGDDRAKATAPVPESAESPAEAEAEEDAGDLAKSKTKDVVKGASAAADAATAARDAVAAALGLTPSAKTAKPPVEEQFARAREEGQRKALAASKKANDAVAKAEAALGKSPPLGSAASAEREDDAAVASTTTVAPVPEDLEERMRGLMIAARGDALANNDPKNLDRIAASLQGALSAASVLRTEERQVKAVYRLDNSKLQRKTWALAYRNSKHLTDLDSRSGQHWGSHVVGVNEGNGWLKVDGRYLPTEVNGKQVLFKENISVKDYLKAEDSELNGADNE
jgi:hypothetical protein